MSPRTVESDHLPATTMAILSYAHNEFDHEFDAERARRLRRRFLWLCGLGMAIGLWWALKSANGFGAQGRFGRAARLACFLNASLAACSAAAAAAAWFLPARRRHIVRLTMAVSIVVGALNLAGPRLILETFIPGYRFEYSVPAVLWSLAPLSGALVIPCLFIPWTLQEALVPSAALWGFNSLMVFTDFALERIGIKSVVVVIALTPLAAVPGCLICWWRHSRFRDNFQLRFESARYRALQAELTGARKVHESCLPAPLDHGPVRLSYVYEPMSQIGGDLLFVHPPRGGNGEGPAEDSVLSAVVLDVTGHGIAAALTVNRLVGEMERLFGEDPRIGPTALLCGLNRYVHVALSRHQIYATALCLRADPKNNRLEWASGGHPTAFLRRADGRVEPLGSTAMLLGVLDGPDYAGDVETGTADLFPGDAVIAYTDGAAEAQCRGEMLGEAGVRDLAAQVSGGGRPPADWPRMILDGVWAHRAAPAEDDTLLVTLYRPGPRHDDGSSVS